MSDYLVKLYELPAVPEIKDVTIRRPIGPEKHAVIEWVRTNFYRGWASEADMAFANHPVSVFIAIYNSKIVGFGCYDATVKGFFGPTGVDKDHRGKGIGVSLLLSCLHAMHNEGYGYAIIGDGIPGFYEKHCGAVEIPNSSPGVYRGMVG